MYAEIDQSDRHYTRTGLKTEEVGEEMRDATYAISRCRERAHLARSRCLSPANTKPPLDRPSAERNARRFRRDQGRKREGRIFPRRSAS